MTNGGGSLPSPSPLPVAADGSPIDRLRADGWAVLQPAIDPPVLAELGEVLDTAAGRAGPRSANERVWDLPARTEAVDPLVLDARVRVAADLLLGADHHLTECCGHVVHPGAPRQYLHADQNLAPHPWADATVLTVVWAVDPFVEGEGATAVVSGSHRREAPPPYGGALPDAVTVPMEPGAALLLDGRVWHGAGPNRGTRSRRAVIVVYGRPEVARSPRLVSLDVPAVAARLCR